MSFTCPECGRTSYHPVDEVEGYCGACQKYTALPVVFTEERARKMKETRDQAALRQEVNDLEKAAGIAFERGEHQTANMIYGLIAKIASSKPGSIPEFPNSDMRLIGDKASLSKMLWDARELVSMFGDVVDSRIPGDSTWAKRLVKEIDAFRDAQGWSPDGFGGE